MGTPRALIPKIGGSRAHQPTRIDTYAAHCCLESNLPPSPVRGTARVSNPIRSLGADAFGQVNFSKVILTLLHLAPGHLSTSALWHQLILAPVHFGTNPFLHQSTLALVHFRTNALCHQSTLNQCTLAPVPFGTNVLWSQYFGTSELRTSRCQTRLLLPTIRKAPVRTRQSSVALARCN